MKKRALLSVSDKSGIVQLAQGLMALGYEIVSSGGTKKRLEEVGILALSVEEVTGFPEMLDGRVKTLHPAVFAAILATDSPEHQTECQKHEIVPIEVVVVNLYPFVETIRKEKVTREEAVENIDIGGPSLIRASAKNHERVYVVVDPSSYDVLLEVLRQDKKDTLSFRQELARLAFSHTADYDAHIADYFLKEQKTSVEKNALPDTFSLKARKFSDLRYGENPHQKAALYGLAGQGLLGAVQHQGKKLSFNNWMDLQAGFSLVLEFETPACAVMKHTNPCGVALAKTATLAYERAHAADPVSAFGSVVAFNRELDKIAAGLLVQTFVEAVVAPSYTLEALEVLQEKKNLRVMQVCPEAFRSSDRFDLKTVSGGFLLQEKDRSLFSEELEWVGNKVPSKDIYEDMVFAMKVVKHVKSNAIVTAKNLVTTGIGPGQTNRVGAARIALEMAKEDAEGSVLASDAFFPFRDTIDLAYDYGVVAIVQPGGSVRDDESIRACQEKGLIMGFTGMRHFKH